jgi:hypothetical protein
LNLKPGTRLRSAVSQVELVVIRAPGGDVDLQCGSVPVIVAQESAARQAAGADLEGSVELGKRYVDDEETLEVLCTKAGAGILTVGSQPLVIKGAKPLPSSD